MIFLTLKWASQPNVLGHPGTDHCPMACAQHHGTRTEREPCLSVSHAIAYDDLSVVGVCDSAGMTVHLYDTVLDIKEPC